MEEVSGLKAWLQARLSEKGWTVDDLAEVTQLNRSTLYHYFTDRSRPSRRTLDKICRAFGVPVEDGLAQYTPRKVGRPK